jgi:chaperonin GroEL
MDIDFGPVKFDIMMRVDIDNQKYEIMYVKTNKNYLQRFRYQKWTNLLDIGWYVKDETELHEIEEKKYRVDDAVAAVKAALAEGIVPGGGVTLINLSSVVSTDDDDDAVAAGRALLVRALEQPFRILLTNSGLNADEWLPQVKKAKAGQGVDVNKPEKLVDLKAAGVVDPTRVTKEALQNAASIAGTSMTMGALVVEVPEPKAAPAPDMGGMGM